MKNEGVKSATNLLKKRLSIGCLVVIISIVLGPPVYVSALMLLLMACLIMKVSGSHQVYMVDFCCYSPPTNCRVPRETFIDHASRSGLFTEESLRFMERVMASSGQGERTCLPPSLFLIPPKPYHKESIEEAQMLLFPVMEDLLSKANMSPQEVHILIVNCSGLCPSPSLATMVVNRFQLREDVRSFNLSGMGCSASVIALHMAANLLKVHKNCNAVILSTEILTTGWYSGKEHSKLALNCVFRMGSAGMLLTNRKQSKATSKYKLIRSVRTQLSSDDRAYRSAFREEDEQGITGVNLSQDIIRIAGEVLKMNMVDLGSSLLPFSEKLKYAMSLLKEGKEGVYVPDFKTVVSHFCLPTSGRRMIGEIAAGLGLDERDTEASIATIHRFGNQSSSSLWYELAYLEAKGRVKKGEKVWQLGMGSGVKSASLVWECIANIPMEPNMGPWADCIHEYPKLAFDFP